MEERIVGEYLCPECGHKTGHILRGKPKPLPHIGTPKPYTVAVDLTCAACGHEWRAAKRPNIQKQAEETEEESE